MRIFLIAGETSGDILGADLINSLRSENPALTFYGAGGPRMAQAGQQQSFDLTRHAVVGLWDVLKNYPKFHYLFHRLLADCRRLRPDVIVFIDFPGFNMRFAKVIRPVLKQAKIFYYVSPQLWAWKPGRARDLQRAVDLLISIIPFEPDWYREHAPGLKVAWVGHPILDRIRPVTLNTSLHKQKTVALMPGSRRKELERHLPLLLETLPLLWKNIPELQFIALAPNDEIADWLNKKFLSRADDFPPGAKVEVITGYTATHLSRCHLALVASGTATLECALAGTPMVVYYIVNPLTYHIAKRLVQVPYLCMVNLLRNKEVAPELIQNEAKPEKLCKIATDILLDEDLQRYQRAELHKVVQLLGEPGASRRAAWLILQHTGQMSKGRPVSAEPAPGPKSL